MNFIAIFVGTCISFILYFLIRRLTQKRSTKGECSICGEIFSDHRLIVLEDISLCKIDYHFYTSHRWAECKRVLSDPSHPENSIKIYEEQRRLTKEGQKCFIKVEYVESEGEIQSIFKLFAPI